MYEGADEDADEGAYCCPLDLLYNDITQLSKLGGHGAVQAIEFQEQIVFHLTQQSKFAGYRTRQAVFLQLECVLEGDLGRGSGGLSLRVGSGGRTQCEEGLILKFYQALTFIYLHFMKVAKLRRHKSQSLRI